MLTSLQTEPEWFSVAGLAINIVAVVLLGWNLLITKGASARAGGDRVGPASSSAWRRIREQKTIVLCVLLLVFGFALQMYGSWPR